jgi:hypothetical protein
MTAAAAGLPEKKDEFMKMTVSEKIARVFEIAGYLWLLPSIVSLIYPVIISVVLILSGSPVGVWFGLIPLSIFGAGAVLQVGYFRHSRGLLGEGKIMALWLGTFAFNSLLLVPSAYIFYALSTALRSYNNGDREIFVLFCGVLVLWQSAAVLMSATAIMSEAGN